ncbi:uncharacterized protein LOC111629260 [Centruroides sculpturatus]|uniref:uncharacterized protein LOC111629260 n=1 Tax=Centruroides sculpturatus TaxID=218467 RepID=UPI000C6DEB27|nr:uncharacterized protein LOC111629260 [Centruroides sculpturatus]
MLDSNNHCLEKLVCQFSDNTSSMSQLEKDVSSLIIYTILNNRFISDDFKNRMKKAALTGRDHPGKCRRYYCTRTTKKKTGSQQELSGLSCQHGKKKHRVLTTLIMSNCYWLAFFCLFITMVMSQVTVVTKFSDNSTKILRSKRSLGLEALNTRERPAGRYFPIALYSVTHRRPGNRLSSRRKRPEVWEYRGQYFYGFRRNQRERRTRLLVATLPILLAPLLSLIFTLPVILPMAVQPLLPSVNSGRKKRATQPPIGNREEEIKSVAHYLHKVRYDENQQGRLVANYLQCNGLLDPEDHCMERLSCEFADPKNAHAPELEKTVTSILLGHILKNPFIPQTFKKRLKLSAIYGTRRQGQCNRFFCAHMDN